MHELGYLCYLEHQLWGEALSIFRDQVRNTLKDSSLGFRGKKRHFALPYLIDLRTYRDRKRYSGSIIHNKASRGLSDFGGRRVTYWKEWQSNPAYGWSWEWFTYLQCHSNAVPRTHWFLADASGAQYSPTNNLQISFFPPLKDLFVFQHHNCPFP